MINVPIITILARNITKAPKFVWTLNIAQKTKMFENVNKYFFLALFFLKRDFKISLKTQFELLLNRKLDFKQDLKSLKKSHFNCHFSESKDKYIQKHNICSNKKKVQAKFM